VEQTEKHALDVYFKRFVFAEAACLKTLLVAKVI
jgi:hypothetical protein